MQVLVNIDVSDLDKAIRFYEAAVDLRLCRRLFDGSVAEMIGASSRVYLVENPAGSAPAAGLETNRQYDRHWTPVHLDFVVDDIDRAAGRAGAAGAIQETPIQSFPWGRLATFSDPFGNGFCLVRFNGAPYEAEGAADQVS